MDILTINKEFKNLKYKLYCYAHCHEKNKYRSNNKKIQFLKECIPQCNKELLDFFDISTSNFSNFKDT